MANHGHFLFCFRSFIIPIHWWCARDSNLGGRLEGTDESTEPSLFFYFCFCRLSLVSVSVFVGGLSFKQNYHSSQFSFLLQFYACLNRRDQSYKHSKIENYSRLYLDSYWLQDSSHCDSLESSFVTVEHFKLANRYCITCHVLTS